MAYFCYDNNMKTPLPVSIGNPATVALKAVSVTTLEDLSRITEKELADLHGVGPKAISILKQCLDENKIYLRRPEVTNK